jgi:hypothetical protein
MTKDVAKVNRKELQQLYKTDEVAKAVFDHFASRERDRRETTIDRLRKNLADDGVNISRGDAIGIFRRLEDLGCGRFVTGRRGHESRFKWDVGLVAVGQAAAGESVPIEATSSIDLVEPVDDMLEHRFHLRKNLDVPVRLPADLTSTEAARLAAFIQTLPFDEARSNPE